MHPTRKQGFAAPNGSDRMAVGVMASTGTRKPIRPTDDEAAAPSGAS
jgi:hypothetical protein